MELYVAKKPYRHTLSWYHISWAGAVNGTKVVVINDKTYKVRLLKTSPDTGNIYTGTYVFDPVGAYGSEWNRLMYSVHSGNHVQVGNPTPVSGEGIRFGTLAQYTDRDLVVHSTTGNGNRSWCQETSSADTSQCVHRGEAGVSYLARDKASNVDSRNGWRPVLELIP